MMAKRVTYFLPVTNVLADFLSRQKPKVTFVGRLRVWWTKRIVAQLILAGNVAMAPLMAIAPFVAENALNQVRSVTVSPHVVYVAITRHG